MDYTLSIGNVNELLCLTEFIKLGYECSIPFGNGAKYDFIVDVDGELIRVQCKSSHYTKSHGITDYDSISFSTVSLTTNTKKTVRHLYDSSQVDYFATHFNGNVYVVPVDECSTSKTLRFRPPSNGNKNYNKAEDYLISKFLKESKHYLVSKEAYLSRSINLTDESSFTCSICEKSVTKENNLREDCSHKVTRKVERPSRLELKDLIRNTPFTQIGLLYNVSDNAIRKWCKFYSLPYRTGEIKLITDNEWQNI